MSAPRLGAAVAAGAVLALALGSLASPGGVAAQDAPPERLTLDEAYRLAERNNPAFRRATNDMDLNGIEQREAWLSVLPRPQLSVLSTGMSWNLQRVGTDPFGNPLPNPEARMIQSSTSQQQAALRLTVDFRNYLQFRHRGDNAVSRRITLDNQLQGLQANVRRGFLDVQERQLAVEVEGEALERERQNQEAARHLFAFAQRERIDLLEAELAVAAQDEALRQAHANLSNALLALRNLIGDPSLQIVAVEPVPLRSFDPSTVDDDALVSAALVSSPAITLQQAQIRAQERSVTSSRAWWAPTLGLNVTTGRSEVERGGGGAFFQPNPTGGWDRSIGVSLNFPDVARYFDQQNTTGRQELTVRNSAETLRQVRLDVEQEVRSVLVQLRSDHAALGLQERRVELAAERLELRLESYRRGRGTFQELQSASDAAAQAERALLTNRYNLEVRLTQLEQTLGLPLERIAQLGGG